MGGASHYTTKKKIVEAATSIGDPPCESGDMKCPDFQICAEHRFACHAFRLWIRFGDTKRSQTDDMIPSAAIYREVYPDEDEIHDWSAHRAQEKDLIASLASRAQRHRGGAERTD